MIVYNVTTMVNKSIIDEWIVWTKAEHIADIIATGCFTHANIFKLLEVDETDGPSFTVQYFAESKSLYNLYLDKYAPIMRQKAFDKWGNKFIAFRSLMQVVD